MNAKTKKILYWIVTGLLAWGMLSGGISQVLQADYAQEGFVTLHYPLYMMFILGTWKILGTIAILLPGYKLVKEWAYAGFFFLMSGAAASHLFSHDTFAHSIGAFVTVLLIVASWALRPDNRRLNVAVA